MLMSAPGYGDDALLAMVAMLAPQFALRNDLPELAAIQSVTCAKVLIGREQANKALAMLHSAVLAYVRVIEADRELTDQQVHLMVKTLHAAAEAAAAHLNEAVITT
jgi:hypothetical protein